MISQQDIDAERERIDSAICGIMMERGPDGHIDGHDCLADFIMQEIAKAREQEHEAYNALLNALAASTAWDELDAHNEALTDCLRSAIERAENGNPIRVGEPTAAHISHIPVSRIAVWKKVLASTPAASLAAHDNALLERIAIIDPYVIADFANTKWDAVALYQFVIRALKVSAPRSENV